MGFRFDSLQPQAKEALAVWEAMRRLGLDIRDIGFGQAPDGQAMVTLTASSGGEQEPFCVMLGQMVEKPELIISSWKEACFSVHKGDYDWGQLQDVLTSSQIFQNIAKLIEGLGRKGHINLVEESISEGGIVLP